MNSQGKDRFICRNLDPPICWHETGGVGVIEGKRIFRKCRICGKIFRDNDNEWVHNDDHPDFESKTGRVELFKLFEKSGLYEEMINPDVPPGWFPLIWITNDDGLFRDEIYKALGGKE